MKAIVIGGGIGGLSAAIALDRVGIEPLVFEQASALREVGAGLTFWSNGLDALAALGGIIESDAVNSQAASSGLARVKPSCLFSLVDWLQR